MHTTSGVLYFGFGSNAHPDMIEAICGNLPELVAANAELHDHQLAIQHLTEIPDRGGDYNARAILNNVWDDTFRTWITQLHPGSTVPGVIWRLTPTQDAALRDWELIGSSWQNHQQRRTPLDRPRNRRPSTPPRQQRPRHRQPDAHRTRRRTPPSVRHPRRHHPSRRHPRPVLTPDAQEGRKRTSDPLA